MCLYSHANKARCCCLKDFDGTRRLICYLLGLEGTFSTVGQFHSGCVSFIVSNTLRSFSDIDAFELRLESLNSWLAKSWNCSSKVLLTWMLKFTVGDLGLSLPRGPLMIQPRTVLVANGPPFSLFLISCGCNNWGTSLPIRRLISASMCGMHGHSREIRPKINIFLFAMVCYVCYGNRNTRPGVNRRNFDGIFLKIWHQETDHWAFDRLVFSLKCCKRKVCFFSSIFNFCSKVPLQKGVLELESKKA